MSGKEILADTNIILAPIAATAIVIDIPFITADKQFSNIDELNLIHHAV